MEKLSEKKRFSIIARLRSTNHAWRGLGVVFKTTHNAWVHLFFAALAIFLGFLLEISSLEWVAIIFVIGLVFIVEIINTALEIDIDLTSPEYHPYAKDIKDVSAGAVALSVIIAGVVGLLIFGPKLF